MLWRRTLKPSGPPFFGNWTAGGLPEAGNWFAIAYGGGRFVNLSSGSNRFVTSTDGINWTAGGLPESGGWQGIAYGGGRFVSLSRNSNRFVYAEAL